MQYFLARSANLPTGLYILPSVISSFLLWAKLSQYLLDRLSQFFHKMKGICMIFLDLVQFCRFLKGRCHGNQLCVILDFFARSESISGSAGPIFAIFLPNKSVLGADDQFGPLFFNISSNQFCEKMPNSPTFIALAFRNGMAKCHVQSNLVISNSDNLNFRLYRGRTLVPAASHYKRQEKASD